MPRRVTYLKVNRFELPLDVAPGRAHFVHHVLQRLPDRFRIALVAWKQIMIARARPGKKKLQIRFLLEGTISSSSVLLFCITKDRTEHSASNLIRSLEPNTWIELDSKDLNLSISTTI